MVSYVHPKPLYQLALQGQDITPKINPYLQSLTLSEARSDEADQLDITLNDELGLLEIPPKGVALNLALGFEGAGLIDKGTFIVDEVSHSGPPDILTIRARSAELTSALRRRRSQSWHEKTLGDIVKTIASRNNLASSVDSELAATFMKHIDQSSESDIAFITRLARHFDAVATVKNGALVFLSVNNTKTAKGQELATFTIHRRETQSHIYTSADRDSYTGVKAFYDDIDKAQRAHVIVGTQKNLKELAGIFANEDEADKEARAEWQRIERSTAGMTLTLATGKPDLMPQTSIRLSGFKSEIDAITWLAVKVSHSLTSDSGLITSLEMEMNSQKTDID